MGLFTSKEKKEKAIADAAAAAADAEFQAKFAAKQERKKVEKTIAEIDKSLEGLMRKAAESKSKGYEDVYRQCLSMIKVARGRKMQAEKFLFQMEAMQEIQSISKSSSELLGSMSNIMNSLGKLTLDKNVMMDTQKKFMQTQQELDRQSASIDQFMGGLEMQLPDDVEVGVNFADEDIEADIERFMIEKDIGNLSADSFTSSASSVDIDNELESLKKLTI